MPAIERYRVEYLSCSSITLRDRIGELLLEMAESDLSASPTETKQESDMRDDQNNDISAKRIYGDTDDLPGGIISAPVKR